MNCFPCFQFRKSKKANKSGELSEQQLKYSESKRPKETTLTSPPCPPTAQKPADASGNINAKTFTFRELATATRNFRQECLLGEGGFGRVYKGTLQSNGQVVAVKQLDRNGMHGNKEFLVEVMMLSLLNHPNLVKLIGYCADGEQRLLVYEYMAGGSLEGHIRAANAENKPLDWMTRMKIAYGAAQALEYLHDKANPPVVYRDLKSSNILLDENLEPKLSDVGLSKLGPLGDKMQVSSRVMGTYGYSAPEYTRSGQLTAKSDVYSFGVVLLELITGRRVIDTTRPVDEQNLIAWAQPIFRDPKRFPDMADPLLKKRFPERSLNQAVAIAAMCLQEEPGARPLMSDAVTALGFLTKSTEPIPDPVPSPEEKSDDDEDDGSDYDDDDEDDGSDYTDDNDDDDDDNGESEEQEEGESSAEENDDVKDESRSGLKNSSSNRSVDKMSESGMESNNETTTSGVPTKRKSQRLRSSSTRKNRKATNEEGSSSSQQKRSKSLASSNRKGSGKSKMGRASSSRKSDKSSAQEQQ